MAILLGPPGTVVWVGDGFENIFELYSSKQTTFVIAVQLNLAYFILSVYITIKVGDPEEITKSKSSWIPDM